MHLVSFWLVIISLLLFIAYAILIAIYKKGWQQCPEFESRDRFIPTKKVSVIIPARNEERTIGTCLASLQKQNYPASLLETIVVDDHSEDATADVVSGFHSPNIKLIRLKEFVDGKINSYKKKAIEVAVSQSTGEWIITTDA